MLQSLSSVMAKRDLCWGRGGWPHTVSVTRLPSVCMEITTLDRDVSVSVASTSHPLPGKTPSLGKRFVASFTSTEPPECR